MDDKEKTVGAILKEARLAKGISLADAEKATSIRSRYLQAVENDEYDKTPGRGFPERNNPQLRQLSGLERSGAC